MNKIFRVTMLAAGSGDAIWITVGTATDHRHIVVDTGLTGTSGAMIRHGEALAIEFRQPTVISALVLTHIDGDHINSAKKFLDLTRAANITIEAIWWNGYPQVFGIRLKGLSRGGTLGAKTAELLSAQAYKLCIPVNPGLASDVPLTTDSWSALRLPRLPELDITLLGPTPERIADLRVAWTNDMDGKPGRKFDEAIRAASLGPKKTLDTAPANGSSIVLLIEYAGAGLLMTGDALAPDMTRALSQLSRMRLAAIKVVKLPHHGSIRNIDKEMLAHVSAKHYLVSSNALSTHHPDPATAELVLAQNPGSTFHFNYPQARSKFSVTVEDRLLGAVPNQDGLTIDLMTL